MPQRDLPPVRLLSVFEAVARTGTLERAAADLNVTQPAVSQSLRALEAHLGVRLLDRGVRPARLTDAGQILHQGVSEGMARMILAIEELQALTRHAESAVTIACTLGTATYWLMPRLPDFYESHPDIAVSVQTTVGLPQLSPDVDMAIRYGRGAWEDGTSAYLFSDWVAPVCSPALASRIGGLAGLATAPLLHVDTPDPSWLTWPQYLPMLGISRPDATQGRRFTNYVQATQAALAGQGVVLGWYSNAEALMAQRQLTALVAEPHVPPEAFWLVTPAGAMSTAGERFRHWLCGKASAVQYPRPDLFEQAGLDYTLRGDP